MRSVGANSSIRTNNPTQVPAMPRIPASVSPEVRKYLETLEQIVTIRLGRRGDPRDRAVTLRELVDSGLAQELSTTPFDPNRSGSTGFAQPGRQFLADLSVPPAPTSFTASGAFSTVHLSWDFPSYSNHSHTEIYAHTSDVVGDATLLGIQTGRVFIDPVGAGQTRYYWARHVNTDNITGPFNSASGTVASTATDVNHILGVLTGAITSSELATSLAAPIGNLPTDTQTALDDLQSQVNAIGTVSQWSSSTSYSEDDLTLYPSTNPKLYRSKTNSNSNNQPSGTASDTTYWEFVGTGESLGDVVANNTANITQINFLDATSTSAAAQKIASLDSTLNDPSTGLSATSTALSGLTTRVTTTESDISTANSNISSNTASISANAADITALESTVNNPTTGVAATSSALTSLTSTVTTQGNSISANATSLSSLTTTVGGNTSSISSQASSINGLEAKYVVKIDNNGAVAGYGLASTANSAGNIVSEFIVNADRFAIMRGGSNTATASVPFVVQASATTLNGESVPAGVYMADAFIKNGSIASAKIGSLNAGKITAGTISADRIGGNSISGSKLKLDSNILTVNNADQLQLVTSNGSNGIKVENLSNDAVGTVHFANGGYVAASNTTYYNGSALSFLDFTSSSPYNEHTSFSINLPLIFSTTVSKTKIKESGVYQLDFGGQVIGTQSGSGRVGIACVIKRSSTLSFPSTAYADRATFYMFGGDGIALTPLTSRSSVYLYANYNYEFKLYGFKDGITAVNGDNGFGGTHLRLFRIFAST